MICIYQVIPGASQRNPDLVTNSGSLLALRPDPDQVRNSGPYWSHCIRFASCVFVENTMPWYGTEKVQLFKDFISLLPLETQVGAVLRGIHSSDLGH